MVCSKHFEILDDEKFLVSVYNQEEKHIMLQLKDNLDDLEESKVINQIKLVDIDDLIVSPNFQSIVVYHNTKNEDNMD